MPRPSPSTSLRACSLGLLVLTGASCGSSGNDRACGPIEQQALDPAALVHVLGDAAAIEYSTDPPTSGPHKAGPTISGVVDRPISPAVQVGILERGDVLLQHSPELPEADLATLRGLAGAGVVVAPNPELPAPVVATAWTYSRSCAGLDTPALRAFIRARVGKGPDG